MKHKLLYVGTLLTVLAITNPTFAQNIGVNATGAAPAASAGFDVNFTNKGLLIPRVALTATNAAGPIAAPATSLLVYNTVTAGATPNTVFPGYYYWDGAKWVALGGSGGKDWGILGNAGTVAGTNFIGTTDAIDWVVKTSNAERIRVLSGGNVGIGTATPSTKLDVQATFAGNFGTSTSCCAGTNPTLSISEATSGNTRLPWIQFHSGGFQEAYMRLASNARVFEFGDNQSVGVDLAVLNPAATTRNVLISGKSSSYFMGGNVGIGTTTPGYRLDLNTGTFAFGNGNVRTESRDNAGLQGSAGAQSGFFETASPSNYPAGAASWWHLIDVRHSNNGNNYAMQLSGSFFDQKLYFRKTNNNAAQPWQELLSSANNPVSVSLAADYTVNTSAWANVAPMTVTFTATKTTALISFTCSGFAYTNSMAYVQFRILRSGTSIGGTNTHMQSYDDVTGTVTSWSCAFSKNITGLTVGTTYTLQVQAQRNGILGVYDAVINAASMPDEHHMTLTVQP